MDVDVDQVQIECMIDKDCKEVKKVKPILIKKEITTNYATQVSFDLGPDEDIFFFTDKGRVLYADHPYEPKIEEETDDDDYVDDDVSIEVDSNFSDALLSWTKILKILIPQKLMKLSSR